jgi:hypothetical protein
MYQIWDHNDQFHWLEATKSCVTNRFSYSFSNSDNQLIKTLTSVGSKKFPGLDGIRYFIGNNMCNP